MVFSLSKKLKNFWLVAVNFAEEKGMPLNTPQLPLYEDGDSSFRKVQLEKKENLPSFFFYPLFRETASALSDANPYP